MLTCEIAPRTQHHLERLTPEVQQELETDLAKVIVELNNRENEVQDAEDDLMGLQKAQLMKQRTGRSFQG